MLNMKSSCHYLLLIDTEDKILKMVLKKRENSVIFTKRQRKTLKY